MEIIKGGGAMDEVIGYLMVTIFIIGATYGLYRQIQHTFKIKKSQRTVNYKRLLLGSYLTSISYAGFLISFVLNVLVMSFQFIHSNIITSNSTAASCFIFFVVLLISKFGITPRNSGQSGLPI